MSFLIWISKPYPELNVFFAYEFEMSVEYDFYFGFRFSYIQLGAEFSVGVWIWNGCWLWFLLQNFRISFRDSHTFYEFKIAIDRRVLLRDFNYVLDSLIIWSIDQPAGHWVDKEWTMVIRGLINYVIDFYLLLSNIDLEFCFCIRLPWQWVSKKT